MRWRRKWPERRPRPKVRRLSDEEKDRILGTFRQGIASSPVLSHLGIRVRALRGRFYFERVWPIPGEQPEVEAIGRATPLEDPDDGLLLEAERRQGSWYRVAQGTAKEIVDTIAGDTKGTFHGLGSLDASLRRAGESPNRLEVEMLDDLRFVYAGTGEVCTAQEALHHAFGVPIEVIAEPRQWYVYHRQPRIVEVSQDRTRVLVAFTAHSLSGPISGTCLYAVVDGQWGTFTIRPNQSGDIATAIAWLEKRQWREWLS
jgi:hypothetical protein